MIIFSQYPIQNSPRWRKLAACAQFKIQNSKFRIVPSRWRKLVACAQFKIQNSKFRIVPLPAGASLQLVPNSKFKIQNSKFKIQNSKFKIQNYRTFSEG